MSDCRFLSTDVMGNSSGHHFAPPDEHFDRDNWEAAGGWVGALNRGFSVIPVVGHVKALGHLVVGDVDGAAGSFAIANHALVSAVVAYNDSDPMDVVMDARFGSDD